MDTIKLKGLSLKGKNRIREHGDEWEVIHHGKLHDGTPATLIRSKRTGDTRWLKHNFDPDFEVIENG